MLRAFKGVDYVVYAAALKQVPACEYNPFEAIKTNIIGAKNVVDAAIARDVKKVIALSTNKALNPINLYGATNYARRRCSFRLMPIQWLTVQTFSVARYGNVVGSRGSVIPLFIQERKNG